MELGFLFTPCLRSANGSTSGGKSFCVCLHVQVQFYSIINYEPEEDAQPVHTAVIQKC